MSNNSHGFYFSAKSGNQYYYDDTSGTVRPSDDTIKEIPQRELYKSTVDRLPAETGSETDMNIVLKELLKTNAYNQIQLIVTEQCNLRCKYCSYSGIYKHNRTHNNMFMEMEIAEKAIRYFHQGYSSVKRRKPNFIPAISFYGGEPLLNFEVINKVTTLVKELFHGKVIFNMTTNGTVISKEMVEFFIDNDFNLMFSLNGNRDEHDRLRVYADGTGSYDTIYQNLQKIRRSNKNYFFDRCSFSITYDDGTDLCEVYDYFAGREQILPKHYRFSRVNNSFTDWYSRYTDQERERHLESLRFLHQLYLKQIKNNERPHMILQQLFGNEFARILDRRQNVPIGGTIFPYTGACLPGTKMAVRPDGTIHCCERINQSFPIGDVNIGLDIDLIAGMIQQYKKQILDECHSCPIKRLCPLCFAALCSSEGKFEKDPPDICQNQIETVKLQFSMLWTLLESGIPQKILNPGDRSYDDYTYDERRYWE